jgi:hypothetical protein
MEVNVPLRLGRLTLRGRPPTTHWIEGCVGPRAFVNDLEDMKYLVPVGNQTMLTSSKHLNIHSKTAKKFINNYTFLSSLCIF